MINQWDGHMSHFMRKPDQQSDQRLCCSLPGSYNTLPAIADVSRPYLVSSAEQAGLSLTWSQTLNTSFLVTRLILKWILRCWPRVKTNTFERAQVHSHTYARSIRTLFWHFLLLSFFSVILRRARNSLISKLLHSHVKMVSKHQT